MRSLEVVTGSEREGARVHGEKLKGAPGSYWKANHSGGDQAADSSSTPAKELSSLAQTTLREEDLMV